MSNEFDYTKLKHVTSVDQSDREVPYNLRQSGPTKVEMLISTRVRKSPYWHLSMQAGCWRATVYNRIYHPRGYVKPEDGGAMVEYDAIVNHVTMWNVAVERQIRVKGPDAEKFTDYVITRDATKISPMRAGCWRATVYNRIYHPRGYVKPEDGGAMVEYDAIVNHVTMWNLSLIHI